jgi:hypothetical protein
LCRMDSKRIFFTLKKRDWRLCTGFIWLSLRNRGGLPWTFGLRNTVMNWTAYCRPQ